MITWTISSFDRQTADGYVHTVHWRCTATDEGFTGSVYGTIGLNGEAVTSYEDLTEEQVIGWVKDAMGEEQVEAHEANVLSQIESQKNPVTASGTPWTHTAAEPKPNKSKKK